ncbi:hypothetical protein [Sphingomonas sp. M1-B02]|uniref:hypothetical protein n=1 Tax=Sphingomonas sp. M1-B02 TaxID=3114300 RepID=UPI0022407EF3|nr:hypothetical protein [Sphingomonas sp. S6-11]UZK65883.1 hypothetical protein OKW87_15440 [Sphingomonas sp. S6-11]
MAEGARLHCYAETISGKSIRWNGTVSIGMSGANFLARAVVLGVRGGEFQFGRNCENEMGGGPRRRASAEAPGAVSAEIRAALRRRPIRSMPA